MLMPAAQRDAFWARELLIPFRLALVLSGGRVRSCWRRCFSSGARDCCDITAQRTYRGSRYAPKTAQEAVSEESVERA